MSVKTEFRCKMLFHKNEQDDLLHVLAAADGFVEEIGASGNYIQTSKVRSALLEMRQDFPAKGGLSQASAFKKCANFVCFLVPDGPFLQPFPVEVVGEQISQIYNHQNAMLAFHIAVEALEGAKIHRPEKDGRPAETIVLENRISLSDHSYVDIIQAIANITQQSHFHLVSVLLEQLCYRANPDASYPLVI